MTQSREEFLNRVANFSFKYNDLKTLRRAVTSEIKERVEKVTEVSGLVVSISGALQEEIDNIGTSALERRIVTLEEEVTRLQAELSLHENNGLHWTGQQIDQRAQSLIDTSSN